MTRKEIENLQPGDVIDAGNDINYIYDGKYGKVYNFHWYSVLQTYNTDFTFEELCNNGIKIKNKMTTMSLKEKYLVPGNVVKTKNNYYYLVLDDETLLGKDGFTEIADYDVNLKESSVCWDEWDIIKVWSIDNWGEGFNSVNRIEEFERLDQHGVKLLWSREDKVEMTVEELEKKLGLSSGTLRIKK